MATTCLLSLGCADFDGNQHPQVVEPREVEFSDTLPPTHYVIGDVSAEASCSTSTEDLAALLASILACDPDPRLKRRMSRKAAKSGGELLVGFACTDESETSTYTSEDEDGYLTTQTETTVTTECTAQVARAYARDLQWW